MRGGGNLPGLCVVVPTVGAAPLSRLLEALAGVAVTVVDDTGGTLALPEGVDRVDLPGPSGFARAANAGLARAEARGFRRAVVLNDDAVPYPGCLEALAAALDAGAAAAGPVLEGPAGVESAGIEVRAWGRVRALRRVPAHPTPVPALSGACLALASTRRFDEAYPHGFEDVALCRCLAGEGPVLLVPEARCWHAGGGTVPRRSLRATRDAVRGHLRLVGAHPGKRAAVVLLAVAQVVREEGLWARHRLAAVWQGLRPRAAD